MDLSQSTDELWAGLKRKSCRVEIKKAAKHNPDIGVNEDTEYCVNLINSHIARKKYRSPMRRAEWARILSHGDVFSVRWEERLISTHALLVDPMGRVRLIAAAVLDPRDERVRGMVGPMNRLLHWHEMNYYKNRGIGCYDFGGLVLDERSPAHNISRFKLSFGGEPVVENVVQLWRGAAARAVLRGLAAPEGTRRILKAVVQAGGRLRWMRQE